MTERIGVVEMYAAYNGKGEISGPFAKKFDAEAARSFTGTVKRVFVIPVDECEEMHGVVNSSGHIRSAQEHRIEAVDDAALFTASCEDHKDHPEHTVEPVLVFRGRKESGNG